MKLRKEYITEEWNEGEDGYWISLKIGYKWGGDPVGAAHSIHEPTRALCWKESVLKCTCQDCRKNKI